MQHRATKHAKHGVDSVYPFTGKIVCSVCGKGYRRKLNAAGTKYEKAVWICSTFNTRGKKYCPTSKQIPEDILHTITAEVLGTDGFDEAVFNDTIERLSVPEPNVIIYHFKDGHKISATWSDRSRRNSWTDEMRRATGEKSKARMNPCVQQQQDTSQ